MLITRITGSIPSSLSSINLPTLNLREVYFTIINRRFFTIFYYNSKRCCELGHLSCRIFKRLICKYNKDNGKNANVKRR